MMLKRDGLMRKRRSGDLHGIDGVVWYGTDFEASLDAFLYPSFR